MNYFWDIEKLFAYFERIWFVNYAYNQGCHRYESQNKDDRET